jgi:hypothetical protein
MREVIYKYEAGFGGGFSAAATPVKVPAGAEVLHAGEQNGIIYVWMRVNPERDEVHRDIRIAGTGDYVPPGRHVKTVQMRSGLVWHVFDNGEQELVEGDKHE